MAADYHPMGLLHPSVLNRDLINASSSLLLLEESSTRQPEAAAIQPAVYAVHYSVTVSSTVLVALIFVVVYVQLVMIICFGYKLISYQTILLFDILLWASLRLSLYSFYYFNCCDLVKSLEGNFLGWLLMSLPTVLQYGSLAILVHYFGVSIFKVMSRRQDTFSLTPPYRKMKKYRVFGEFMFGIALITFLAGNTIFYFVIGDHQVSKDAMYTVAILRVVLLDGLFLVMAVILAICIIIIYVTNAGRDVLDAQRGRKCWPLFISVCLILLFASRGIYSVAAVVTGSRDRVHFGYSWTFATDEGDNQFGDSNKYGYIAYFFILIVWEVTPTYIIIFFFRVRLPRYNYMATLNACKALGKKKPATVTQRDFFENPNRYDESDHLLPSAQSPPSDVAGPSQMSIPSLTGSITNIQSQYPPHPYYNTSQSKDYGSSSNMSHSNARQCPNSKHSINTARMMPGTTPPKLWTSPSFLDR